ncbi:S24 family peptidase [Salinimonas chungwhensis]|uniref:S24 family peptidase n=1 Tax=Salinimonas chungwhensis TaxID=265425 RepID=UPI000363E2B1|nr:S24 family peptidase [Salinimonas chungwhensis]
MLKVIPVFAQAGISGFESPAAEYRQLKLDLDELLIEHPTATFIGQASGDSMTGVGIFDGDLLIVDRAAIASPLDVVVANLNGSFVCKLFDRNTHTLLSPGSNQYGHKLREGDTFEEEGIVIRSVRLHRYTRQLAQCLR